MFKHVLLLLSICFFSTFVYAENEGSVSLFDEDMEQKNVSETKEKKDSFFSFMNFKMPENLFSSDAEKKEETPENTLENIVKMANNGNLQAQLALGYAYLYGENGLSVDYDKAFEYYNKAALQNDPIGLNNLGSLYYSGLGVQRDVKKAVSLFEQAAKLGNNNAAVNVGFMYVSGRGVKKNIVKGLEYLETSLVSDTPAAKYMMGYAYYKGIHRGIDYSKAAKLLKEAADEGFDEAQLVVASLYVNGLGFPQNYNNAVKYLKQAIAQGNSSAMVLLADILVEGKKYNRDIESAYVYYNLASVRGATYAAAKRNELEKVMKIDEILSAQKQTEYYKEDVSPITLYIRQTYGENLVSYFEE